MLFKFSQLVKQTEIYDTQLLSKICPLQLKHKYLILEQKIKEAKELELEIYKMKDEDEGWKKLKISLEFTPQNTLNSKFIIIRHALAWHNYFKRVTEFKDSNIYHYDLIDPPLQYLGTKQCDKLKLEINKLDFDKVYVSPLAIQTTQLLFCNHPQKEKIQFILCPDICEKISTINSLYKWGSLTELLKDNGNPIKFDFSEMPENLEFWQFNLLQKSYNLRDCQPNKEDFERFIVDEFVRKGSSFQLEYSRNVMSRVQGFVNKIKEDQTQSKIGIVTHFQIIKSILQCSRQRIDFKFGNGAVFGLNL
ncbi:unnamed protein product [Paramecium octaurelia]|uniref:Histidine phosphatase family (Branch protein 1) n=1 Tax=Paramecium octaurelia TaxID=43137 RepID=A0A8S1WYM4_PAROT|nr:unnamed protein product [Paramecium octaurelia]